MGKTILPRLVVIEYCLEAGGASKRLVFFSNDSERELEAKALAGEADGVEVAQFAPAESRLLSLESMAVFDGLVQQRELKKLSKGTFDFEPLNTEIARLAWLAGYEAGVREAKSWSLD